MAHSLKPTTPSFVSQGRDNGDPRFVIFSIANCSLETSAHIQEVARSFLLNINVLQTVMGDLKTETT